MIAALTIAGVVFSGISAFFLFWRGLRRVKVEARRCRPRFDPSSDLLMWKAHNRGWRHVTLCNIGVVAGAKPIRVEKDSISHDDSSLPTRLQDDDRCYVGQSLGVVFDGLRTHGLDGQQMVQAYFEDAGGRRFFSKTFELDPDVRIDPSSLGVNHDW